nr:hypothetical protein [Tanacetum cinerariifolium]
MFLMARKLLRSVSTRMNIMTSANEQQVVGNSETHVDLVSSSLCVSWVPGTAYVVALLGVSLNTLGDIDNLTKAIELGKLEDAFLTENPNAKSDYYSDSGNSGVVSGNAKGVDTVHLDESPIIQSANIQNTPQTYVGAARGESASDKVQPKVNSNFRPLVVDPVFIGVNISIPRKVVEKVFEEDGISLIATFIGKSVMLDHTQYPCVMIRGVEVVLLAKLAIWMLLNNTIRQDNRK